MSLTKKDLSGTEDITFAMRNRQEWFNEKMAAVSPEIVSYFFASNAPLTIRGGYNHLVINNISVFYRGLRKEFRVFLYTCKDTNSDKS